jgi:hypothetical protein
MAIFEDAQRLFTAYQRNGGVHNLRNSLDILQEIIEAQNSDSQKATNLKNTISKHINDQKKGIHLKGNLPDFLNGNNEERATILLAALNDEDLSNLIELVGLQSEFFKEEST